MHTIAWWPTVTALGLATFTDVRCRRIPNWLVVPFLIVAFVVAAATGGLPGVLQSAAGAALAFTIGGVLWFLKGMGMGDVKLLAAVGAWIGPYQFVMAFIAIGMIGGFMAVGWALWHRSLGTALDGTADLVTGFWKNGVRPHPDIVLENSSRLKMPYAPAIALGTIFSFFMV